MTMPIAAYAGKLAKGEKVAGVMTPDRVADLLVELADEGLRLATDAQKMVNVAPEEIERYVSDSQALVDIAQAWRHKVLAAIEKRILQAGGGKEHRNAFVAHLDESVAVYEKLVTLTDQTYINPTDMVLGLNWHNGLARFKADVASQQAFLKFIDSRQQKGVYWIEAAGMEGNWKSSTQYAGYLGKSFRVSVSPDQQSTALRTTIAVRQPGRYTVWAHGYLDVQPGRSFVVEVGVKKFPATHQERGTLQGQFVWRKVGEVDLKPSQVEIAIRAAGAAHACADAVVLAIDPAWTPPE